jgi:cytochrome c oxidase subunit 4
MLRSNMLRAARGVVPSARQQVFSRATPAAYAPIACQQQTRNAHAISNPELANIEKRWEEMPPQEQADLWMALRDRMKAPWTELTIQEKKAGMSASDSYNIPYAYTLVASCKNVLNAALLTEP